ncbi:MAG: glycerophosphoryl diester phosphodiesterase membrane domain-containing protein [Gaiellaceae bacterium]|jgi:hypothetical protein
MNPTAGVLGEAWAMYKAHWRHLLPIALVVYVAVGLVSLLLALLLDRWAAGLLAALVSLIATFWLQGALVKAIDDVRDGRPDLSLGETFARVRPQLVAIIVAGVLAAIGVILGLILLIIPGLYLLTRWILIIPVIVLEGRTAGESFGRSWDLVRGFAWNVFGVIVLTILILIGFRIALEIILFPLSDEIQSLLTELIAGTLATPFAALAWTLLYFRLREAKEPAQAPATV